ncbi:mycothiol synthase [Corynebacterium qintianiae]|uniref:Mycothiol acetyltransferase n=1 Tax=Corynebacterium qintianiae TaxID=2709392 RepID=A0A7T0PFL8_9CORY|nr:mycothiol synthase [Corynebacterium qintianiae]QPK82952.1 mycothiol synthase [Corynebacterium qintianiae]
MTNPIKIETLPGDEARRLLAKVEDRDEVAAFSEQFLAGLNDARVAHTHLTHRAGDQLVGIAAIAGDSSVEMAVDPDFRRGGIGSALMAAVFEHAPGAGFWAHGDLPAAQALAARRGLSPTRELLVMEISGAALEEVAHATIPEGFEALSYSDAVARWGRAGVESAWLRANNEAFEWHPEQGGWDEERLHRAMEAEWFDPEGVRFLYEGESLAGFHWTKMHPDGTGEVYVVGLDSSYRRKGLGDPLLRIGLEFLAGRGSSQVKLYVEADNGPAVKRYENLGFVTAERHVVYRET